MIQSLQTNLRAISGQCLMAIAFSAVLHAGTIYDNTVAASDGSDSVQTLGPLYGSFTADSNGDPLTDLQLILSGDNTSTGGVSVDLYADNSTSPGALIANLGSFSDSILGAVPTLYDVPLANRPSLAANVRYWIGLTGPESSTLWAWSMDTSGPGVASEYYANVFGPLPTADGAYQMSITGGAPTPESPAFFLIVAGLGSLFVIQRVQLRSRRFD